MLNWKSDPVLPHIRNGGDAMSGYPLDELTDKLRSLADEKYRIFNESLTPGAEGTSFGVRMPALRRIAREILRNDPSSFLDASLGHTVHEINLLHAILLAKESCSVENRLMRIRGFVPTIGNWAVCDLLCNDLKPSPEFAEALLPRLRRYSESENEYEIRFALVMLMLYYRDPAHIDETFRLYASFRHEGYYARMGAAWGLSFLFVDWPERTLELLKSNTLDRFTHNKAIQKCIESYRVSAQDKKMLRTLRR